VSDRRSHGTLPRFSPQGSRLSTCYYHQDPHWGPFDPGLPPEGFFTNGPHAPLPAEPCRHSAPAARCERRAPAPSIFGAGPFGRWVVTHSLAGFDFHDHRPAVRMGRHPLWDPHGRALWRFNLAFGSSRIASSAYQKRPTKNLPFTHKLIQQAGRGACCCSPI